MNSSDSCAKDGKGRVWPARRWGYSNVHFRMNQATGLMSMAVTSQPRRMASVRLFDLLAEEVQRGAVLSSPVEDAALGLPLDDRNLPASNVLEGILGLDRTAQELQQTVTL